MPRKLLCTVFALTTVLADSSCQHPSGGHQDGDGTTSSDEIADDSALATDVDEPVAAEEETLESQGFCKDDIYTTYLREQYKQRVKRPRFRSTRTAMRWRRQIDSQSLHFAANRLAPKTESYFGAIPIVVTPQVESWIRHFKTTGRHTFMKWLVRGESVKDVVQPLLRQLGMPQELFYLSMIESGFSNTAYSKARATGPWQFVSSTAKMYGLKINYWYDERRDPVKSTIAASKYLQDLYARFGDWYLAMAAYNAGPGRVRRAIRKGGSRDFWQLSRKKLFKLETRNYVPKMLAALILGVEPRRHGFVVDANPIDRLPESVVYLKEPIHLNEIARNIQVPVAAVKRWNPELTRSITPPRRWTSARGYPLRIPVAKREMFERTRHRLSLVEVRDVHLHRVSKGETFASIARRYKVPVKRLLHFNPKMRPRRLRIGKSVAVPVPSVQTSLRR